MNKRKLQFLLFPSSSTIIISSLIATQNTFNVAGTGYSVCDLQIDNGIIRFWSVGELAKLKS